MELSTFSFPTEIRFGPGARAALADFAARHQVWRPLLVTDPGMVPTEAYRLVAQQMDLTWPQQWHVSSEVHPNPLEPDVEALWTAYQESDCDAVVGLGGGSALDAAKAVRLKAAFPQSRLTGIPLDALPARLIPMAAIPTTAGTGSEVGRSTVITIPELGRKVVLGGPPLMPELAILDAELTVSLPPHLTAATGMDAMTHAIESYVCPMFHPMCDAIALEAVRIVTRWLPIAVDNGVDIEARGQMLIAASMGAVSFQKDLGATHSLAHPLSTDFGVHHGLANAVLLPTVVRFNGQADSNQYARVAQAMGLVINADNDLAADKNSEADPARAVADALEAMNRRIGITQRLRDLDIPRDALASLAEKAMQDGCHLTNPRPCTLADMVQLYQQAW
jgi:alcohol dehydrogenase class IV